MKNFHFKEIGLITPVYYLAVLSAVSIPIKSSVSKLFRLYALTIAIVFLCNAFGIEIWRLVSGYDAYSVASTNIMHYSYIFILALLNIIAILMPCFIYPKDYSDFLSLFFEIDTCLQSKTICKGKIHTKQNIKFCIVYGIYLIMVLSELYVFGVILYKYVIEDLQTHHLIIEMCVIDNVLVSIKLRYKKLNQKLHEVCNNRRGSDKDTVNNYLKVRKILKAYELLINQVDYFNAIFGWQIFLLILLNTAAILLTLNLIMNKSILDSNKYVGISDIMFFAIRSLFLLVNIFGYHKNVFTMLFFLDICCFYKCNLRRHMQRSKRYFRRVPGIFGEPTPFSERQRRTAIKRASGTFGALQKSCFSQIYRRWMF